MENLVEDFRKINFHSFKNKVHKYKIRFFALLLAKIVIFFKSTR